MTATALYRVFDHQGVLLYVGITGDMSARLRQHKEHFDWWPEVCSVHSESKDCRAHAAALERVAIRFEAPKYNRLLVRDQAATGDIKGVIDAWPRRQDFAEAVGQPLANVHKWAQANRIPTKFHAATVAACQSAGHEDVTAESLMAMHGGAQ